MEPVELSSSSSSSDSTPSVTRPSSSLAYELRPRASRPRAVDQGGATSGVQEGFGESVVGRPSFHQQYYPVPEPISQVEASTSSESWLNFPGGNVEGQIGLPEGPEEDFMIIQGEGSAGGERDPQSMEIVARIASGGEAGPPSGGAFRFSAEGIQSVLSITTIREYLKSFHIPGGVYFRETNVDEWACAPSPEEICLYEGALKSGLRLPFPPFVRDLLEYYHISPGQLAPNSWKILACLIILWMACGNGDLTLREFQTMYKVVNQKSGWAHLQAYPGMGLIVGLPTSNKGLEKRFFFVGGDVWEFYPWEKVSVNITRIIRVWTAGVSADLNVSHDLTPVEVERLRRAKDFPVRHASGLLTEENLRDCWWGS